ncbi:hypothetical protein [Coralloluteibacterium stylophorae]|uniref:Uncharacterized protein n=1 Tax=Coralloluteibacterium stylophorae TaxID=1776034 RepID=A0A8J8B144_9GAMM|nr:hypothetical protein [Coralloluteibacterium stylophorae]MBS7455942.1 hypothetical protein [Coralloluteibacterium stylophorae]
MDGRSFDVSRNAWTGQWQIRTDGPGDPRPFLDREAAIAGADVLARSWFRTTGLPAVVRVEQGLRDFRVERTYAAAGSVWGPA